MLRLSTALLASKVTAGNAKNQKGGTHRTPKLFHVVLDTPVTPSEALKEQRSRYGQDRYSREPAYRPGRHVAMDPNTFTLYATRKGVVSVRESRINPSYRWLDVEPDIQRVRRTREVRQALAARGRASALADANRNYDRERAEAAEPRWRERVLRETPARERFQDPNLFTKGLIPSLDPLNRYCYE